ncbi:MAG TPA: hypothetical protein GXX15_04295 [Clostridia bacterium]|nr:hypothetical protein [Clostridia bacterium]
MKRGLAVAIIIIILFHFVMTNAQNETSSDFYKLKEEEQRLVLELLDLEVEKVKAEKILEELSSEIENLNITIEEKSREIQMVSKDIEKEKDIIRSWLRFLYMEGTNAILSLLLMAQNATELLHRIIYIDIITNYFYDKLDNLNRLVKYKKEEENKLSLQRQELLEKQKEQLEVLKKIEDLRVSKSKMLEDIKKRISDYQKIFSIADSFTNMFPSLDYLLSHLSQLPWDTLEYKDLSFSFFSITVSFTDEAVTKMVRSYNDKLKEVTVYFSKEGFTIKDDDDYTLKGTFTIENDKIKLLINSLEMKDIKIEGQLLEKILQGYDTTVNIKIPFEGFKLKKVNPEEGYVKFVLEK